MVAFVGSHDESSVDDLLLLHLWMVCFLRGTCPHERTDVITHLLNWCLRRANATSLLIPITENIRATVTFRAVSMDSRIVDLCLKKPMQSRQSLGTS